LNNVHGANAHPSFGPVLAGDGSGIAQEVLQRDGHRSGPLSSDSLFGLFLLGLTAPDGSLELALQHRMVLKPQVSSLRSKRINECTRKAAGAAHNVRW
jgi:hypothetical protein